MDWNQILINAYLISAIGTALHILFYAPNRQPHLGADLFAIFMPILNTFLTTCMVAGLAIDVLLFLLEISKKK